MKLDRTAGVLLHPTSLWSPGGRGDLGAAADAFLDWMVEAGLTLWQTLPTTPTGAAGSPYASPSAFAADPWLIPLDDLLERGLLERRDPGLGELLALTGPLDHGAQQRLRPALMELAAQRLHADPPAALHDFAAANPWVTDWARFAATKAAHGGGAWWTWGGPEATGEAVERQIALQFLAEGALRDLKARANRRGVRLVGDLPIFVSRDSADVWAQRQLFRLHEDGSPQVVAGVPPDAFSETGQLWGNPLYDWPVHESQGFTWWSDRMRAQLERADAVRVDHFRGFAAAWTIPADAEDARSGSWEASPGRPLFDAITATLRAEDPDRYADGLPLIAEDLGVITDDVRALRDGLGLPGMKILQFAFGDGPEHEYLPANHPQHCVVYPGTHDNDTALGWYRSTHERARRFFESMTGAGEHDAAHALVRMALGAPAGWCIVAMQDFLGLPNDARMNVPSTVEGNWIWRMDGPPPDGLADQIRGWVREGGRG